MKQKYLRDQRGVAMLLELVLVAVVLALAGLAVYQANHRGVASVQDQPKVNTAAGLAESAATVVEAGAASEAATSAGSDAMADELSASSDDITALGDVSNATF